METDIAVLIERIDSTLNDPRTANDVERLRGELEYLKIELKQIKKNNDIRKHHMIWK